MLRGSRPQVPAVLILVIFAFISSASVQAKDLITVLRSPGAQGQLSPERARLALRLAADELKIAGELPRVVIVLGCEHSAEVVDLPMVPDGRENSRTGAVITEAYRGHVIYYLWLLDEPGDQALAHGLVQILLIHSKRPLTGSALAVSHVTSKLQAQIHVKDLNR